MAVLALPLVVAFLVPILIAIFDQWRFPGMGLGLVLLLLGVVLLLWCVRDFYVAGKGTLAPWDPPEQLVVVGLYRYSRNLMYVAVLIILSGWTLYPGVIGFGRVHNRHRFRIPASCGAVRRA